MRILIVEDEIKIRMGISRLISAHTQHTVVGEAKNGKEGLEMISRFHPELVISDIRMPVMDGLEMLQESVKMGNTCHFVILSGYSEFEYAQTAIRYGVDDYLLKPLAPEDVTQLLDKIQKKIDQEEAENIQTTEGILRELILGGRKDITDICKKLLKTGVFEKVMPIFILAGYMGNTGARYSRNLPGQCEELKEKYPELKIYPVILENTQEIFLMVQGEISTEELERKLTRRIYQNLTEEDQPVWVLSVFDDLEEIQEIVQNLRKDYLYGIRMGYREILTEEKIKMLPVEEFQYPVHLENRIQTALCSESPENLKKECENFLKYTREMKCSPRYIRKTYKKMLAFLENVCHEVNQQAYISCCRIRIWNILLQKRLQQENWKPVSGRLWRLFWNPEIKKKISVIMRSGGLLILSGNITVKIFLLICWRNDWRSRRSI